LKLVLILLIFSGLLVFPAYALPPPPPTNFVASLVDESNVKIEVPSFLKIEEILDGEILQSYRIDLFDNPQTIPVNWYLPNRDANTEIHIVASKQGYQDSEKFVFTITSQTPTEGILFENTFVLSQEETSKIIDKDFQVSSDAKSHTISTSSSSNIQSIEFIENENTLLVIVSEDSINGFSDLNIPISLISPPFNVLVVLTPNQM